MQINRKVKKLKVQNHLKGSFNSNNLKKNKNKDFRNNFKIQIYLNL